MMLKRYLKKAIPLKIQKNQTFKEFNRFAQITLPKFLRLQYEKIYSYIDLDGFLRKESQKYDREFYESRMNWYLGKTKQIFEAEKAKVICKIAKTFEFTRVLDIACGIGLAVKEFSKLGYDVYGIDISNQAIDFAKKNFTDIAERVNRVTSIKLPFKDKSFDLTFSYSFLTHMHPRIVGLTLKEISRVTKKYSIHITTIKKSGKFTTFEHHPTSKPRSWWIAQFEKFGFKQIPFSAETKKEVFAFIKNDNLNDRKP
jgi:SAM-dependent methyltransferase